MTSIKEIVATQQREQQRSLYKNRRWRCLKCRRTFRCRPEQVDALIEGEMDTAPLHCGLPMVLGISSSLIRGG